MKLGTQNPIIKKGNLSPKTSQMTRYKKEIAAAKGTERKVDKEQRYRLS